MCYDVNLVKGEFSGDCPESKQKQDVESLFVYQYYSVLQSQKVYDIPKNNILL